MDGVDEGCRCGFVASRNCCTSRTEASLLCGGGILREFYQAVQGSLGNGTIGTSADLGATRRWNQYVGTSKKLEKFSFGMLRNCGGQKNASAPAAKAAWGRVRPLFSSRSIPTLIVSVRDIVREYTYLRSRRPPLSSTEHPQRSIYRMLVESGVGLLPLYFYSLACRSNPLWISFG